MTSTPRSRLAAAGSFALATILLLLCLVGSARAADGITLAEWSKSEPIPAPGSFTSFGGGDGYNVFFDDAGHVFNIWHHDGKYGGSGVGAVDCHTTGGASCGPGWPFTVAPYHTSSASMGYVDNAAKKLWFPTNTASQVGFACVDLANVAGPQWCGGSAASAFTSLQPFTGSGAVWDGAWGLAADGPNRHLYTVADNGTVICFDVAASPAAACSGFTPPVLTPARNATATLLMSSGKVFGAIRASASAGNGKAFCYDAGTGAACTATFPTVSGGQFTVYEQPASNGTVEAVCFREITSSPMTPSCFTPNGSATATANTGLANVMLLASTGALVRFFPQPLTTGTRVYYGDGLIGAGPVGSIGCYDVATAGSCAGSWPVAATAYAFSLDPTIANCVWKNDDFGAIAAYSANGTLGCGGVADSTVTFTPTLPCESGTISTWHSFALSAPAAGTYSSATLTVTDAAGAVVTSGGKTWFDVAIAAGSRTVDLTDLKVADTGTAPKFAVTLKSNTATGDATAALVMGVSSAVGCTKVVPDGSSGGAGGSTPSGPSKADTATSPIVITGQPDRPRVLVDGRTTVTIRANNTSTTTAKDTKIVATVPQGFRLVRAPGAKVKGRTVTWTVGDLKAGSVASRKMTLVALRRGRGVVGIRVITSNAGTAVATARIIALPRIFPVTG